MKQIDSRLQHQLNYNELLALLFSSYDHVSLYKLQQYLIQGIHVKNLLLCVFQEASCCILKQLLKFKAKFLLLVLKKVLQRKKKYQLTHWLDLYFMIFLLFLILIFISFHHLKIDLFSLLLNFFLPHCHLLMSYSHKDYYQD